MNNIIDELNKNQTILFVIESDRYNTTITETVKKLPQEAETIYITLNKTASSLQNHLLKEKISVNKLTIIDCISKTIQDIRDTEKIIYLESPKALSDLSFVLTGVLKKSKKDAYLLFDSLTTLLVYSEKPVVARFLLNIVNRIRNTKCKAILFAVDVEEHRDFFKEIGIFVDKVIKPKG